MTLCLVWKENGQVNFASDSRSGNDEGYIDTTLKIFRFRVKIDMPEANNAIKTVYDHDLAVCYSGMVSDSVTVIQHVSEAMQNLQYVPGCAELSLENICEYFGDYFIHIAGDTKIGYDLEPDSTFLLSGFCPLLNEVAVYQIGLFSDDEDEFQLAVDRVLEDEDEIVSIGSGSERARTTLNEMEFPNSTQILKLARTICRDEYTDVGGYIQYGKFNEMDFALYGIQDYEIDEQDNVEIIYTYRGVLMYNGNFEVDHTKFQLKMRFLCPFQDEIDKFLDH